MSKITHPIAPSQNPYLIFAWFISHLIKMRRVVGKGERKQSAEEGNKTVPAGGHRSQGGNQTHQAGQRIGTVSNTEIYSSLEVVFAMIR